GSIPVSRRARHPGPTTKTAGWRAGSDRVRHRTGFLRRVARCIMEIALDVDIDAPPHTAAHAGGAQSVERLMGRAARPEAIRTGEEVLLVDRLQHHRYSALRHLVFEGRDAERPLRAVRFRDVGSAPQRTVGE